MNKELRDNFDRLINGAAQGLKLGDKAQTKLMLDSVRRFALNAARKRAGIKLGKSL